MGKGTSGNPPMLLACMTRGSGEGGGPGWPVTTAMTTSGGDGEKEEEVMVIGAGSEGEGDISVEPILVIMADMLEFLRFRKISMTQTAG